MYYHASQVPEIKILEPRISNHNIPLIYFSTKRENVLVYLSNAIEKYCKETNFEHSGKWHKWATYGFDENEILILEEYYPNAIIDTYKGVAGYIYYAENVINSQENINIPNAVSTSEQVNVDDCEFVPDAYLEIMKAAERGKIIIRKYEDMDAKKLGWIKKTIKKEYDDTIDAPDYRYFLKAKFPFVK